MTDYNVYTNNGAPAPRRKRRQSLRPAAARRAAGPPLAAAPAAGGLWPKLLKIIALAILAVISVTAGIAVGWLRSTVATVQSKDPVAVSKAAKQLTPPLPGEAVNILFIGADHSASGDPGRSDSQILVRLDPKTKSISMLSIPRDWWVDVPGVGMSKINAAYAYGGPALAVQTISRAVGLPINHFVRADFNGFWDIVKILGGVYLQVDRHYYDASSSAAHPVSILPGYQLLQSDNALHFVRFRHDQYADFGRMQRQQLFLRELQGQSRRWSDWTKLPKLLTTVTKYTLSDISSLRQLVSFASLVVQLNTSHIYQTHIEGATPMIAGQSVVVPSQQQVQTAVAQFLNPVKPPAKVTPSTVTATAPAFSVRVLNGSGKAGESTSVASQLVALGYQAASGGNADSFTYTSSVVSAPASLAAPAQNLAHLFAPATVQVAAQSSSLGDGITVTIGSSFGGQIAATAQPVQSAAPAALQLQHNTVFDRAAWQQVAAQARMPVLAPTVWADGFTYSSDMPFRSYRVDIGKGRTVPAVVAVITAPASVDPHQGAFDIQEIQWTKAPILAKPMHALVVKGRRYSLFFSGDKLTMVAWTIGSSAYWVTNTIDNALPNNFILALATSFKPVK
ncbi:MAG: LCP family protein [Thermoleophilia bacterium]